MDDPKLLPHITLGQFLGALQLYDKGLVTPEHTLEILSEIAKEYHAHKSVDGSRRDAS